MNVRSYPGAESMARCTKAEALETRERLLDAAVEVFRAEGVSRPSLSKVAERAGLTRGAVYGHFENKTDLFEALCERVRMPSEELARCEALAQEQPLRALRQWCLSVLRDAVADPERRKIFEILFQNSEFVSQSGIRERRLITRRHGGERIRRLVARAVETGDLPADLDVDRAARLVHHAVVGTMAHWLFDPEEFDLAGDAEAFADALLDSLRCSAALRRVGGSGCDE